MLTVLTANSQAGGFTIANSLRFRASASAYLSRTPSVAGNRQTWTWSGWVKRGNLSSYQNFIRAGGTLFRFTNSDTINYEDGLGSTILTSAVYRDPSSWYHVVLLIDTTQSTTANRLKVYVNGVQQTVTGTYPTQNSSTSINNTVAHYIGQNTAGAEYFDGYMADINFIDGQALAPSSFGAFNATTGVWQPIRYSGTYGTNGFYLPFSNGTSTTTLGYDSSGNGNNWTTNNISLTAGSTYDWMIDSPTKYPGSSYGVGNYCVLNPLNPPVVGSIANANSSFQRDSQGGVARNTGATGTFGISSGKWYFELIFTAIGSNNGTSGTGDDIFGVISTTAPNDIGTDYQAYSLCWCYQGNGNKSNGSSVAYGNSLSEGDIVGVALDLNSGKIFFSKNGTWQASGDPAAGTNAAFTNLSGYSVTPVVACYNNNIGPSRVRTANFGQRPFAYTPPSGYKSLCTQNLPGVTIQNGAQYMAATTYTGTGSSVSIANTVNGVSFQPDFVWVKARNQAYNHALIDSVRGIQYQLASSNTSAELTDANGITALSSSGFSVGTATAGYSVNTSSTTYVGWQWKAGGTAVTNTAGSISSQVSANTTAGFSVVTYTGNGAADANVGHGLGIAPYFIIVKNRSNATDWVVYHQSLPSWDGGNYAHNSLKLNTTGALANIYGLWSNSTSTIFTISDGQTTSGDRPKTNANGDNYVAYCWAPIPGYSAFGSYTGNGSSDGPFVYCGFRPRFVMVKCSSNSGDAWFSFDSSRDTYNVSSNYLCPNLSQAEGSYGTFDLLSNGFKLRQSGAAVNGSGYTYIYAAFCEVPMNFALAR